jgi:O-antigen ligase
MGSIAINRVNYDSPWQKFLLFFLCLGRMDGLFYENKIIFAILIGLSGMGLMFNFFWGRNLLKGTLPKWQTLLLSFFFVSIFWAYSREQAITIWIAYLGRSIIILYIYSYLLMSKNFVYASKVFILAVVLVNLHFLLAFGISGMLAARAETIDLGQGWNANALGMQSVVACFLILNILSRKKNNELFKFAILPFLVFFILLTGSKTCFFLLFGSILLVYFLKSNRKTFTLVVIFSIIAFLSYMVFNVPFLREVIGERLEIMIDSFITFDVDSKSSSGGSASDNIRLFMLFEGWQWFLEKPLIGYGVGNFQEMFGEINGGKELYAHNNYIELLVDTGIIGALMYYWLYVLIIWKSMKGLSKYELSVASFMIVLMVAEFGHVSYLVFCIQFLLCIFACNIDLNKQNNVITNKRIIKSQLVYEPVKSSI